jgi:Trm5-related predicted tRNA methylase
MSTPRRIGKRRVAGLLGLAFDADDGHTRITRGKHFFLAGGSEDSHDHMRETVVKVTEELDRRGQQLTDISVRQLCDLLQEAQS